VRKKKLIGKKRRSLMMMNWISWITLKRGSRKPSIVIQTIKKTQNRINLSLTRSKYMIDYLGRRNN